MANSGNDNTGWKIIGGIIATLASLVTILAFFGITHFPFPPGDATPTPTTGIFSSGSPTDTPTADVPAISTPDQSSTSPTPQPQPTPEPRFTPAIVASTPPQTMNTFCGALQRGDSATANAQLTPRYYNYIVAHPAPFNDPYTGCTFGSFTRSSTSAGVIYYYTPLTFYHRSGMWRNGVADLIEMSDGSWKIDEINCGAGVTC